MKEMLYEVRCLKSNEDTILALAGQFKGPHSPKCVALQARQIWISCDTKLSKILRSVIVFFHYNRILHIYLIRLCKYVPCSTFYSFPVLFCTYSVYIYKISRNKLTSTRRDGGLFELLECVQPIRLRVWTIERFKTKTNDRNESWKKVDL